MLDRLTFHGPRRNTGAAYERWAQLSRRARQRSIWRSGVAYLRRLITWTLITTVIATMLWYRHPNMLLEQIRVDFQHLTHASWSEMPKLLEQMPAQHAVAILVLTVGLISVIWNLVFLVLLIIAVIVALAFKGFFVHVYHLRYVWRNSIMRQKMILFCAKVFVLVGLDDKTPRMSLKRDAIDPLAGAPRQLNSDLAALRMLAEEELHSIRFLQTHTTGWSGKITGSKGFYFGLQRSIQRAEQPLTHPEVVEQFRDFLDRVTRILIGAGEISGIIIAIDELDKLNEPEDAHTFLNEIKGIFGIDRCLFVISVSEDALTSFERRGIPIRDALDSAFTTMISVKAFTLDESRHWLSRRVIGLPEPFIGLCHCLSAGIPRELSRAGTAVANLLLDHDALQLQDVTQLLVNDEIAAKTQAFSNAAQRLKQAEADLFVIKLNTASMSDSKALLSLACDLVVVPSDVPCRNIATLRWEAASYLYFCATLLDFFNDDLGQATLVNASVPGGPGSLDNLAKGRRAMSLTPRLAWHLVTEFRQDRGLTAPQTSLPSY